MTNVNSHGIAKVPGLPAVRVIWSGQICTLNSIFFALPGCLHINEFPCCSSRFLTLLDSLYLLS